jgi:agmatine/peptidylarginine deiminase
LAVVSTIQLVTAQQNLPKGLAPGEEALIPAYASSRAGSVQGITTPPAFSVRSMAEWEEIQALVITWTQYQSTLREIVRYAKEECTVIIVCSDSNQVIGYLNSNGINKDNLQFIEDDYNSIWMRDYGANTIYQNDVDSLLLVDWIYNRPRPDDDVLPERVASYVGVPFYTTTVAPYDLVHTGGNFMSDGFGTAFSSKLVVEENGPFGNYNQTVKTEVEISTIMEEFMGIENYVLMDVLPYDGIHHIDMHMKLLDEETLLIGEYPSGQADGPQIEANLQYVLNNYNSVFGTPYEIIRIEMPPDGNGMYPDQGSGWNTGDYRTFTNSIIINKTVLVPTYEEQYDTTALRIYRENMPGYRVEGIDCNSIIQASGALHCITKAVGVEDPLLISHQELSDITVPISDYEVNAFVKHRSGISNVKLYYTTDTSAGYQLVTMSLTNSSSATWTGYIPEQIAGSTIYYYVDATANSGKTQVRPMTAPTGYWKFKVLVNTGMDPLLMAADIALEMAYPNPAGAITCIPVNSTTNSWARLRLLDVLGREVRFLFQGELPIGRSHYFFRAEDLLPGAYLIELTTYNGVETQKIMVK